ncbi:MAG: nuclear transport factor 2 family protein [Candidatus Latescibacteria bacterium]|nr:nuclear transport factor 2 family protein [Candidatus Latescibacterota bacterium]
MATKLSFAELIHLSDAEIQTLLREVDQKDFVVAFSATDKELKQKFMNQMSEKVRTFISEEMEFLSPMPKAAIKAVQQRILQQAVQLGKQGKVSWPPGTWKKEEAKRVQSVQHVISRYHRAIEKKDADAALGCLSRNYFQAGRRDGAAGDPTRWVVGSQPPKAFFRKWVSQGSYACAIEFLHTHINENVAVVVTRETGSSTSSEGKTHSWKGVSNLWFLAKAKGEWKIVNSVHYISD